MKYIPSFLIGLLLASTIFFGYFDYHEYRELQNETKIAQNMTQQFAIAAETAGGLESK